MSRAFYLRPWPRHKPKKHVHACGGCAQPARGCAHCHGEGREQCGLPDSTDAIQSTGQPQAQDALRLLDPSIHP
ncbi:MAG TPA: hypothetical protein VNY25_09365 [Steroidobacteraceae bacterium]|nr:hypothetical protein [Steroidobacteraceae bacterium]